MSGRKTQNVVSARKTKELNATNVAAENKPPIWPEWSDQDINAEKWDDVQNGKERSKQTASAVFFFDPEGSVALPPTLNVAYTKRPHEFITERTPVVYDLETVHRVDLYQLNEHLFACEAMRWIICEVQNLWMAGRQSMTGPNSSTVPSQDWMYRWRPWEHIYAISKIGKEPNTPQYNPFGKYVVKLHWMGCWRKLLVDDVIPFGNDHSILLPRSRQPYELWPMLLTKALLKIASLCCGGAWDHSGLRDFSAIQCLTGWLKQSITVRKRWPDSLWHYLQSHIPAWERPEDSGSKANQSNELTPEQPEGKIKMKDAKRSVKDNLKAKKNVEKIKSDGKEKAEATKSWTTNEAVSRTQKVMMFVSYENLHEQSSERDPDAINEVSRNERLKAMGFDIPYSHPIMLSTWRSIPLIEPAPKKPTPNWKLIRPRPADFPLFVPMAEKEPQVEVEPVRSLQLTTLLRNSSFAAAVEQVPSLPISTEISKERYAAKPDPQADRVHTKPRKPTGRRKGGAASPIQPPASHGRNQQPVRSDSGTGRSVKFKNHETVRKMAGTGGTTSTMALAGNGLKNGELSEQHGEEETRDEVQLITAQPLERWIDINEFCELFTSVEVYHNTQSYPVMKSHSVTKGVRSSTDKIAPTNVYLLSDSLSPVELILGFSVIPHWPQASVSSMCLPLMQELDEQPQDHGEAVPSETPHGPTTKVMENQVTRAPSVVTVVIETCHWFPPRLGEPVKRLQVSGSRAASLFLPSGRHSFAINISSPLGYNLTVLGAAQTSSSDNVDEKLGPCSTLIHKSSGNSAEAAAPYLYLGDEDHILSTGLTTLPLSLRQYSDHLVESMHEFGVALACLSNPDEWPSAASEINTAGVRGEEFKPDVENAISSLQLSSPEFQLTGCASWILKSYQEKHRNMCHFLSPSGGDKSCDLGRIKNKNHQRTLLAVLQKILVSDKDGRSAASEMNLAWRAIQLDMNTFNPFNAKYSITNPRHPGTTSSTAKQKGKGHSARTERQLIVKSMLDEEFLQRWSQPADQNILNAIVRIQAAYRGYRVRQLQQLRNPTYVIALVLGLRTGPDGNEGQTDGMCTQPTGVTAFATQGRLKKLLTKAERIGRGWKLCMDMLFRAHKESGIGAELVHNLVRGVSTPFTKDLSQYVSYRDYHGTHAEIPAPATVINTIAGDPDEVNIEWLKLVFRAAFQVVSEPNGDKMRPTEIHFCMRCQNSLPGSHLILMDNDNGAMLLQSSSEVDNWIRLCTNRNGYALLCVAGPGPTSPCSWQLRLVGSGILGDLGLPQLLGPITRQLCTTFQEVELSDYYVPHPKGLLFKRQLEVSKTQLLSFQLRVSAPDVPLCLLLRRNGTVVASAHSRGDARILSHLVEFTPPKESSRSATDEIDAKVEVITRSSARRKGSRSPSIRRALQAKQSGRTDSRAQVSVRAPLFKRGVGKRSRPAVPSGQQLSASRCSQPVSPRSGDWIAEEIEIRHAKCSYNSSQSQGREEETRAFTAERDRCNQVAGTGQRIFESAKNGKFSSLRVASFTDLSSSLAFCPQYRAFSDAFNEVSCELNLLVSQVASDQHTTVDTFQFSRTLHRLLRYLNWLCRTKPHSRDQLFVACRLLLSNVGRDASLSWLSTDSPSDRIGADFRYTLGCTLWVILRYIADLPPQSFSTNFAVPLRVLENMINPTQETPKTLPFISPEFLIAANRFWLYRFLAHRQYFRIIAQFIDRQLPIKAGYLVDGTGSNAPSVFDPVEFSKTPKTNTFINLFLSPITWTSECQSTNSEERDSTLRYLLAAALNQLLVPTADGFATNERIICGIVPRLFDCSLALRMVPRMCLSRHHFDCPSVDDDHLIPSIHLLYTLVAVVVPKLMSLPTTPSPVDQRDPVEMEIDSTDTKEEAPQMVPNWKSIMCCDSLSSDVAAELVRCIAWLLAKTVYPPNLPCPRPLTPLKPLALLCTENSDRLSSDDEADDDRHSELNGAFFVQTSGSLVSADVYLPAWDNELLTIFSSLRRILLPLSSSAMSSIGSEVLSSHALSDDQYDLVSSLAQLHFALDHIYTLPSTAMIGLNSLYSQHPIFIRSLWHLIQHLEPRHYRPGCGTHTLFRLLVSGELPDSFSDLQRYIPLLMTFASCLHHRLLCLTDVEIGGESFETGSSTMKPTSLGCGFNVQQLLQVGCQLRNLMLGLINISHPDQLPQRNDCDPTMSNFTTPDYQKLFERVAQRAETAAMGGASHSDSFGCSLSGWSVQDLRAQLHCWSSLFYRVQRLVFQIYDWHRRVSRQSDTDALCSNGSESSETAFSASYDRERRSICGLLPTESQAVWFKESIATSIDTSLKGWLRGGDKITLTMSGAPFGYHSRLNADRGRDGTDPLLLSNREIRQVLILKELPFVIPFERRVRLFQLLVESSRISVQGSHVPSLAALATHSSAERYPDVSILVRRTHLYEDSFDKLSKENEANLRPRLRVRFMNQVGAEEAGIDGGGLSREFLSELIRDGFDPTRGFFIYTAEKTLYPNPQAAAIAEDYLKHYYFLGRILAKALYESMLVDLQFAHFFLAKIASRSGGCVGFDYLRSLDPELYRQLQYLKTYTGDVKNLSLDFTIVQSTFGQSEVIDLKPGGRCIPVTNENRVEYMHLVAHYKLNKQIYPQVRAFAAGLNDVICIDWLRLFDADELQILISGANTVIDIDDLEKHTVYPNDASEHKETLEYFWTVLRSLSESDKRLFLRFVTACSRPPMFGFRDLQPPFSIQVTQELDRLPTASTCMNLLRLPDFRDPVLLRERLLYALHANAGFEYS
ncbi:unnamed protein product [Dicrocoelium dendriticum]|nr:unnamed protein product [Dicrocoelium dendriticum]